MGIRYPRRVTRRIILYIFVFSSLVGVLATAVQVYFEYQRNISTLEREFLEAERTVRTSVAHALWIHDLTQLRILADGIVDRRDLASIEIRENGTALLNAGVAKKPAQAQQRVMPIDYQHRGEMMHIGEVVIVADLGGVSRRVYDRAQSILLWNSVQTLFVAIFAFFVFSHLLTRHVHGIAGYLQKMDPRATGAAMRLDRMPNRPDRRDELDMLVAAINDLRGRLTRSQEAVKQSRDELEVSERRYRMILEDMLDTYFRTNAEGRLTMISASASRLLGWPVKDLLGAHVEQFYLRPDGHDKFMAAFAKNHGIVTAYEEPLKHKNGGTVWISTSARLVRNEGGEFAGVEGIVRNITDQRVAADALRESEQRLRLVANSLPAMILYVDKNLKVRFANKMVMEWYGHAPEDIVGRTVPSLLTAETIEQVKSRWAAVLNGEAQNFDVVVTFADATRRAIEMRYVPRVLDDGSTSGFFALGIDVTQKKALEDRLRQSQKMEALGQLTGGVAHDFNNLLGVILGNVELLLEEPDMEADERGQLLDAIMRVGLRGSGLTRQLLAFSRQQPLMQVSARLDTELAEFAGMLQRTLGGGVTFEMRYGAQLRPCLVDRPLLENALLNLALNARDAMQGEGKLTIVLDNKDASDPGEAEKLELEPGHYVSVAVSDTGIGMSADVVAHAFEPFYTTKDVGEGTGLGLSMVYGFARQSGGSVSIASTEGKGTTVVIYLPRAEAAIARDAPLVAVSEAQGGGERILVVEDDPDMRRIASETLERLGYAITTAADGPAAIRVLEEGGRFDLVLTDIRLPNGMLGPDVARQARQIDPALKIVYMTGYAEASVFENGAIDDDAILLRKPFRRADLAAAMDKVLHTEIVLE